MIAVVVHCGTMADSYIDFWLQNILHFSGCEKVWLLSSVPVKKKDRLECFRIVHTDYDCYWRAFPEIAKNQNANFLFLQLDVMFFTRYVPSRNPIDLLCEERFYRKYFALFKNEDITSCYPRLFEAGCVIRHDLMKSLLNYNVSFVRSMPSVEGWSCPFTGGRSAELFGSVTEYCCKNAVNYTYNTCCSHLHGLECVVGKGKKMISQRDNKEDIHYASWAAYVSSGAIYDELPALTNPWAINKITADTSWLTEQQLRKHKQFMSRYIRS
jgi:hypothetical protein